MDTEVAMMLRVFDWILVFVIVVLAWRSLNDRDLFRAVIKFIALGLLIAVAWVRLRAPDVALAEAAVGSGLPSRAEVTDAAMSARAECVMLNKGPHILSAVRFLDGVLSRMQAHQYKKRDLMRRLEFSLG